MMGFFRCAPARLDRLVSVSPLIGRMLWHELRGRRTLSLAERLAMLPCRGVPVAAPVSIRWNEQQIPFIVAGNEDDLAVGLGMVHAHRRLEQLELTRRLAYGRALVPASRRTRYTAAWGARALLWDDILKCEPAPRRRALEGSLRAAARTIGTRESWGDRHRLRGEYVTVPLRAEAAASFSHCTELTP